MSSPSLHYLLSSLRSPIFNTAAVTSNARTGAKYLKRRLRADNALLYAVQSPTMRVFANDKNFRGWEGLARPGDDGYDTQLPIDMVVPPSTANVEFVEVPRAARPGPSNITKYRSHWIEDANEYVRFDVLDGKRANGKTAPKKGEFADGSEGAVTRRGSGRRRGKADSAAPRGIFHVPESYLCSLQLQKPLCRANITGEGKRVLAGKKKK
ncbi:hypothetical protein A1Q2_03002 [Trichosporon asahii var. asahii CBS 8904]|uniref:Uncharacterized protein n=2 Tax=Trichosporon asahii var. asahii TaxID=189963 RepID=K1VT82_TRIAC|nr:hypothetical protein A1Q1_06937 [Trichosporon asahii var. asahii CBS 2479]EJT51799.1 hypothetical protein A1Q1_06937 [Trichosporon asahii var. asahii CBS 2479]EKD02772.1 hypothetical protein A1Q2_03002 [Trichosporon asahii var. asahii CBS 8904]